MRVAIIIVQGCVIRVRTFIYCLLKVRCSTVVTGIACNCMPASFQLISGLNPKVGWSGKRADLVYCLSINTRLWKRLMLVAWCWVGQFQSRSFSVSKLSPKWSGSVVMRPYYTLIRLQPSTVFSRQFPCWALQLWSENCASTLVTAVLFSSWPWVMYCFHYPPMYLGCSLCSVLILWPLSFSLCVCLALLQV